METALRAMVRPKTSGLGNNGKSKDSWPLLLRFLAALSPDALSTVCAIRTEGERCETACEALALFLKKHDEVVDYRRQVDSQRGQDEPTTPAEALAQLKLTLGARRHLQAITCARRRIGCEAPGSEDAEELHRCCLEVDLNSLLPAGSQAAQAFGDEKCSACGADFDMHVKVLPCSHLICRGCSTSCQQ